MHPGQFCPTLVTCDPEQSPLAAQEMVFTYLPPSDVPYYLSRQKSSSSGKSQWSVAAAWSTLKREKTNVVLHVGPQQKPTYAHSSLLIKESKYFAALAEARWTSPNVDYVEYFTEFSVESMELFFVVLYEQQLPMDASLEQIMEIHMLSRMFHVSSANALALEWFKVNLNASNCVTLYHHAKHLGQSESLAYRARTFIQQNPDSVLWEDDQLCLLTSDLLALILRSEQVHTSEFHLFQSLIRWTTCVAEDDLEEYSKRLEKCSQLSVLIRYALMTKEEFLQVIPSNIFTPQDADLMLTYFDGLSSLPQYLMSFSRRSTAANPLLLFINCTH